MKDVNKILMVTLLLTIGWMPTAALAADEISTKIPGGTLQALHAEFLTTEDEPGFWQEVQAIADAGNYPFVESLDKTDNVRLTFLHRQGAQPPANVLLLANINHVIPAELLFERIGQSGVYFKTVEVPKGVRFLYRILENDPQTGLFAGAKYGTRVHLLGKNPDPINPNKRIIHDAL